MKVYDCFTFFNELDLLEIRLNILNDNIDYFVLVEARKTHSGLAKELYYQNNLARFKEFAHKIIHVIVDDMPEVKNGNRWDLENFQRNAIIRGLNNCEPDDIIIISDLDEIPNLNQIIWSEVLDTKDRNINIAKKIFSKLKIFAYQQKNANIIRKIIIRLGNIIDKNTNNIIGFKQKLFYYYLNGYIENNWLGSKAILYKNLINYWGKIPQQIRNLKTNNIIENGGWHFSYLLNPEKITNKIKSFAHAEFDQINYTDTKIIIDKISSGESLFDGKTVNYIKLDDSYPKYILDNQEKYRMYIKEV